MASACSRALAALRAVSTSLKGWERRWTRLVDELGLARDALYFHACITLGYVAHGMHSLAQFL